MSVADRETLYRGELVELFAEAGFAKLDTIEFPGLPADGSPVRVNVGTKRDKKPNGVERHHFGLRRQGRRTPHEDP
jgi:hypothetical protein